jgi:DNA-binding XRE family transcriptional regulator
MDNLLRSIMKKRRAQLRLSQVAAAKKAGVDLKTWGRWEKQDTAVRPENWTKIARALDLQIDDLQMAAFSSLQLQLGLPPLAVIASLERHGDAAAHVFRVEALAVLAEKLEIEVNKADQQEFQFPLGRWRTMLRRQLIAIEQQIFAAEAQTELFRDFVLTLIGEPSFRKIERLHQRKLRVGKLRVRKKNES